ncbi:uncharacterized protein C9orf40 homolog [Denticeps clupeoides]|uniref:uncharacterized protein C9orf40 homolog n=1 Tax=Denticeps clupeoides TaxID=299321 RepID=UPI0010A55C72|nr:uncharacterized protein C9orf40 homolog [Denticeps clupeoides]
MTKRRSEDVICRDAPLKKCRPLLRSTDEQALGVGVDSNPAPAPPRRDTACTKRLRGSEDSPEHRNRKVQNSGGCSRSSSGNKPQDARETPEIVTRKEEDDLCTFNSFQYWRVPVPELDMSLLQDDAVTPRPPKDVESMET